MITFANFKDIGGAGIAHSLISVFLTYLAQKKRQVA